jgi:hypothetical protein
MMKGELLPCPRTGCVLHAAGILLHFAATRHLDLSHQKCGLCSQSLKSLGFRKLGAAFKGAIVQGYLNPR